MSLVRDIKVITCLIIQLFIVFPYSVLTIPRQRKLLNDQKTHDPPVSSLEPATMISDKVYKLCTSKESVSALLAADPNLAPGDAWKQLYGDQPTSGSNKIPKEKRTPATPEDLQRAFECGNWGPTKPSELFLQVRISYHMVSFVSNMHRCIMMRCVRSITMLQPAWLALP